MSEVGVQQHDAQSIPSLAMPPPPPVQHGSMLLTTESFGSPGAEPPTYVPSLQPAVTSSRYPRACWARERARTTDRKAGTRMYHASEWLVIGLSGLAQLPRGSSSRQA